jgi:hypothetical protein
LTPAWPLPFLAARRFHLSTSLATRSRGTDGSLPTCRVGGGGGWGEGANSNEMRGCFVVKSATGVRAWGWGGAGGRICSFVGEGERKK